MAYVKQGPWGQGSPLSADQITAMDEGIAAAQTASAIDLGVVSGTVNLDASSNQVFVLSLSADVTLTFSNMNATGHMTQVTMFVTANAHTITWPAGLAFDGGSAPSLTGSPDEIVIESTESSILVARHVGTY